MSLIFKKDENKKKYFVEIKTKINWFVC